MKTILLATDYSRAASNALAYAASLAKHMQAKLVLFNSFQLPPPIAVSPLPEERKQRFVAENKSRLSGIAQQISRIYEIPVSWDTTISYITEALDEQVLKYEAELVVMGMCSNSSDRKMFGSSTTSIIRHAKYPVLVVPEEAHFSGIEKILFACDYKISSESSRLSLLREIAEVFEAQIEVLHIEKEVEELVSVGSYSGNREQLDIGPILASVNLDPVFGRVQHEYKYIADRDVIRGINRGIQEYNADMLVMIPHKTGFWDSLMDRSNTCKMALSTHVPLLALPQAKKK